MARLRKRVTLVAAFAAASVSLAACGSNSTTDSPGTGSSPTAPESGSDAPAADGTTGGTIHYFMLGGKGPEHLDPQRLYIGRDLANMGRLVYRSLVAYPSSEDPAVANTPMPDLATDTGTSTDNAMTWEFTLKDGVKWQDGQDVTCADLKYGMSRSFATDVITGGPNYILGLLDVPQGKDGLPIYQGPYKKDAKGEAAYDKAVSCSGKTITYHFNKPFADFPLAIAALRSFDPYRKDLDKGDANNFTVISNGPYMQAPGSKFDSSNGGKFVRNPMYDPATDSTELRKALPDEFDFEVGVEAETQYPRFLADSGDDQTAVTATSAPPAFFSQISNDPAAAERAVNIASPFTSYLVPNFNQIGDDNPDGMAIREALAAATDKAAYSAALGGEKASKPGFSIVNPAVPGYADNPAFKDNPANGDPAKAKQILSDAGVQMPVDIKFTYPGGTPTSEKAFAALKEGWDKAGFNVSLNGLTSTYYDVVQSPSNDADIMWGGWGADWPSIGTVIPPLFDSRINLTKSSNGQDYGAYKSDAVNSAIDAAAKLTDVDMAASAYADIDAQLGKDVAYIPLDVTQFYYMHGSKVGNYLNSISTSGYPDLGPISVLK